MPGSELLAIVIGEGADNPYQRLHSTERRYALALRKISSAPPQPADFPRELLDPLHLAVGHVAPLDEHEGHGL